MKFFHQTPGDNQCLRHCVASLFEMRVEDVPFFGGAFAFDEEKRADGSYGALQEKELRAWLRERGMDYFQRYAVPNPHTKVEGFHHDGGATAGFIIACGPTERNTYHAVVWRLPLWNEEITDEDRERHMRTGMWGQMVHDPHPSGIGLLRVESIKQFIVIDPALYARWVMGAIA